MKQNRLKTSKNIKLTNHGGNECKNNIFTFFKLQNFILKS